MFKVVIHYGDWDDELEEEYSTYDDAMEAVEDYFTDYNTGGEILHMSNPGEYPVVSDSSDLDYDIYKI